MSESASKIAQLEEEKRKMMEELEKLRGGKHPEPTVAQSSASKLAALEEEKKKLLADLEKAKHAKELTVATPSDSASKMAALEEEKRKLKAELDRVKKPESPATSESASKIAALEKEKTKMMEELRRIQSEESSASTSSSSATKLSALEEEKKKLQMELEKAKSGSVSKVSESSSKIALLEEEKRKMEEELKRLKTPSDSATKLKALEEEKLKLKKEMEKLSASKSATSDSASKLTKLEEEKRALESEVLKMKEKSVSRVEEDPELRELERKIKETEIIASKSKRRAEEEEMSAKRKVEELKKVLVDADPEKKMKELEDIKKKLDRKQRGVDLCIVMDCTGSMGSWMREACNKATQIIDKVKEFNVNAIPRVAFVGYRDICDGNQRYEIIDFVEAEKSMDLKSKLDVMSPTGGGDQAEDVAGAFKRATLLNWMSSTKLIVHFADAPAHGTRYHEGVGDDHPGGDPDGLNPEDLLRHFASNKVDYYFARINSTTDKMMVVFESVYKGTGRKFSVIDVGGDASQFLPSVIESLSKSVPKSF